jgi:hypothetical protein
LIQIDCSIAVRTMPIILTPTYHNVYYSYSNLSHVCNNHYYHFLGLAFSHHVA